MTSALVLDNTGSKVSSWLRWKCFVLPVTPAHCTLPGGCWLLTIIVTIFVTQLHTCARQDWIYLCQNILFETSRIQETYYFWFCFSKNIRKTQIGEVNINRLILSQQVVKMFWIPPSPGRWWSGTDRRVTVDTATPLAAGAGVLVCCDTRRCDESCLTLLTCSLEVVKSKA